jgi:hypothetical protein
MAKGVASPETCFRYDFCLTAVIDYTKFDFTVAYFSRIWHAEFKGGVLSIRKERQLREGGRAKDGGRDRRRERGIGGREGGNEGGRGRETERGVMVSLLHA